MMSVMGYQRKWTTKHSKKTEMINSLRSGAKVLKPYMF